MENSKTVYFLGAGASAGSKSKLPTMKEFFKTPRLDSGEYDELKGFITNDLREKNPAEANLEEVVTHVDISLRGFGAPRHEEMPEVTEIWQQLRDFICDRLWPNGGPKEACPHLLKIASSLRGNDSILTLNYDMLIEQALLKEERGHFVKNAEMLIGHASAAFYDIL